MAVQFNQPTRELTRCGDANLLAKHRADSNLESIPPAGSAQTGTLLNEAGECGVGGEMLVDGIDIGSEIEQPPNACNNGRKRFDFRKQDSDLKTLLFGKVR